MKQGNINRVTFHDVTSFTYVNRWRGIGLNATYQAELWRRNDETEPEGPQVVEQALGQDLHAQESHQGHQDDGYDSFHWKHVSGD